MKLTKINSLNINFTGEEYAALCIAKDLVAQLYCACGSAKLLRGELGDIIEISELPRVAGILDTLTRSIDYRVE